MPFFDIALPKPFVKALVGGKGKGKGKGKENKADGGEKRRPSWVRLGRSGGVKSKPQTLDKSRMAGTVRTVSSSSCVHLEPTEVEQHDEDDQDQDHDDEGHTLARWDTRMPHGSPREARYSLSAELDDTVPSARPASSLSFDVDVHAESSEGPDSDSDSTTAPTEGTATPVNDLSRSPSYKKHDLGVGYGSLRHSPGSSPLGQHPPPLYPEAYGLRLVSRDRDRAPQDEYFDAVLANLPSFRPLHPAVAFNDEGEHAFRRTGGGRRTRPRMP